MIVKDWDSDVLVNGEGYAQYLASKHNKKVNLYEIDYGRSVKEAVRLFVKQTASR